MSEQHSMIGRDEVATVVAILRSLGVDEVFITRETLYEAHQGILYVEEDFQRDGLHIRIGER